MIISELYRYPLKGGQAEALTRSTVLPTGFPQDRSWLLVDANGRFLSQREFPTMALIQTNVGRSYRFQFRDEILSVDPEVRGETRQVTVWKDSVAAWDMGDEAAKFFSKALGCAVRLCAAKDAREVDGPYAEAQTIPYYFADSFPYLVISQESLDLLNSKLNDRGQGPVPMNRFRPNIVIKSWQAHAEDQVQTLCIGNKVRLRLAKPCSRCNVTTIDQSSATVVGAEPLATLATYRKLGTSKILFGMNAWLLSGSGQDIAIGDTVSIE